MFTVAPKCYQFIFVSYRITIKHRQVTFKLEEAESKRARERETKEQAHNKCYHRFFWIIFKFKLFYGNERDQQKKLTDFE